MLRKIKFVQELNEPIKKNCPDIENLEYKVFESEFNGKKIYKEFLVCTFCGGSFSVRDCTGNSVLAIIAELPKVTQGGYYDEVEYFKKISQLYNKFKG